MPFDIGTSNRPGARFGPRHIRAESVLIRPYNMATRAAPFDSLRIDDVGDVATKPPTTSPIRSNESRPPTPNCSEPAPSRSPWVATTRSCSRSSERSAAAHGPVGLIHVDAHTDINDSMFGEKIAHGTPFRRAVEEGLLDCDRVAQIGVRGTGYEADDFDWSRQQGFRVVQVEECWHTSLTGLMGEVVEKVGGGGGPVYLSFDIDGIDPSFAPGTGTPEIAGLTVAQSLEIIRACRALNLVGADLVEVAPVYDPTGGTSLLAANLLYEMLCVLPGVEYRT